jgi:polyphosphate kinase 2 (PPK2 family)
MGDHQSAANRTRVSDDLKARPRRGRVDLTSIDPSQTNGVKRRHIDERTLADEEHITALQECLHAEGKRSILIVLQGMDTSGKDGTIRHALRGLNPQGVRIVSFKHRLGEPRKRWKFSGSDIKERRHWDDYQIAYAAAIGRCSTAMAPWYVIPADRKWYRNWAVSRLLIETMKEMKLTYPNPHLDVPELKKHLRAVA